MLLVGKNWCRHKDDDVMYYRPSVSQLSASIIPLEDVVLSQQPLVSLLLSLAVSSTTFFGNLIPQAFSVATFLPQPFWILMIVAPNSSITKRIMGDYKVVTLFCLVHLFIVLSSLFEPDGTAPLVEFADVFDPSENPLILWLSHGDFSAICPTINCVIPCHFLKFELHCFQIDLGSSTVVPPGKFYSFLKKSCSLGSLFHLQY